MADSIAAIRARIAATFDSTQTNPLQSILDEEGPDALIDAVLTARNETAEPRTTGDPVGRMCDLLRTERDRLVADNDRLREAIETHRDTHTTVLPYRRDARLYAALGDDDG